MNHRLLWHLTLWGLLLTLLGVLCAPLVVGAKSTAPLEMFVSPRVHELREWGESYTVWAAIRTSGDTDMVDVTLTSDPRIELTGAMPTYGLEGGGACFPTGEARTHLRCYASAEKGWVGITVNLKLTSDPAKSWGRDVLHTVTACANTVCQTSEAAITIPEGTGTPPPVLPVVLMPLVLGGQNVGTDTR
jgi:hypothetical protein